MAQIDSTPAVVQFLRDHHLKATGPRIAVLSFLMSEHGPFTVKEIQKRLSKKGDSDLVTVYRCVTQLEDSGLIRRCDFGDGNARYEFSPENDHHHHHIICRKCRRVDVVDHCNLKDLDSYGKKLGYKKVSHSLEFFGLCPKCQPPASAK